MQISDPTTLDIGFSPILPGGETLSFSGLQVFSQLTEEVLRDLTSQVLLLFGEYALAKGLSIFPQTWIGAGFVIIAKFATQFGLFMLNFNDKTGMLALAFASQLMALIACSASVAALFVSALFGILYAQTLSAVYLLESGMIVTVGMIIGARTWVDGVEIAMDIGLAVIAFLRYYQLLI